MTTDQNAPRKLPGNLNTNRRLDRWLKINRDGTVTAFPGKVEIGQGILTALAQIVAEELDIALERLRLAPADTTYSPDEGMTSGSQSITDGGVALRYAAAEARFLLLQRAAVRLGVSLEQLSVADGVVSSRSGGSVSYWDLATDDLLAREATAEIAPKPASQHTVIGTSAPRRDLPAKVSGAPVYVHDLDLPGMLHGRIARPPSYDARLVELDEAQVRSLSGVVSLVRDGSFVGVVAEREEQALRALARVKRMARWEEKTVLPETTDPRFLLQEATEDEVISEKRDAAAAARGAKTLEAEYTRPSGHPAQWRGSRTGAIRYGRTARASTRCATTSPACWGWTRSASPSSTWTAPAATATTVLTTLRSTRCCWRARSRGGRCGCNGRARTNSCGSPTARPWS